MRFIGCYCPKAQKYGRKNCKAIFPNHILCSQFVIPRLSFAPSDSSSVISAIHCAMADLSTLRWAGCSFSVVRQYFSLSPSCIPGQRSSDVTALLSAIRSAALIYSGRFFAYIFSIMPLGPVISWWIPMPVIQIILFTDVTFNAETIFFAIVSTSPSSEHTSISWPSIAFFTSASLSASPHTTFTPVISISSNFFGPRTNAVSRISSDLISLRVIYFPVCPAAPKTTAFFMLFILSLSCKLIATVYFYDLAVDEFRIITYKKYHKLCSLLGLGKSFLAYPAQLIIYQLLRQILVHICIYPARSNTINIDIRLKLQCKILCHIYKRRLACVILHARCIICVYRINWSNVNYLSVFILHHFRTQYLTKQKRCNKICFQGYIPVGNSLVGNLTVQRNACIIYKHINFSETSQWFLCRLSNIFLLLFRYLGLNLLPVQFVSW